MINLKTKEALLPHQYDTLETVGSLRILTRESTDENMQNAREKGDLIVSPKFGGSSRWEDYEVFDKSLGIPVLTILGSKLRDSDRRYPALQTIIAGEIKKITVLSGNKNPVIAIY